MLDDFAEFGFDGVPGHGFAFGVFGAAGEEHAEGEDAAGGLDVFFGDGAGDSADVDSELVGDADHGERFHELGAVLEEFFLGFDDDAEDAEEGVAALFDGFDEPACVADIVGDELAGFAIDGFGLGHAFVDFVDVEAWGVFFSEAGGVFAGFVVAFDDGVGADFGDGGVAEEGAGAGVEVFEEFFALVDLFDGEAALAGDLGEAVHFEVVEVGADEDPGSSEVDVVFAFPGVDLEEEAFL